MPEGIARVQARIQQIESLLQEPATPNEEFGAALDRAANEQRQRPDERTEVPRSGDAHSVPQLVPASLAPLIEEAAGETGLPGELISAVIATESNYRPDAVSPVGALGLMQLMPGTAQALGVSEPFDPRQNILGGARYLSHQLQQFGTVEKALAAYNAGPRAVEQYGGIPPYRETQNYVRRVLSKLRELTQRE
jgi:soluble lytic murein transglycosylase-like protein